MLYRLKFANSIQKLSDFSHTAKSYPDFLVLLQTTAIFFLPCNSYDPSLFLRWSYSSGRELKRFRSEGETERRARSISSYWTMQRTYLSILQLLWLKTTWIMSRTMSFWDYRGCKKELWCKLVFINKIYLEKSIGSGPESDLQKNAKKFPSYKEKSHLPDVSKWDFIVYV